MDDHSERSPWICHICGATGRSESTPCARCHRTTCQLHLAPSSRFDPASGLYQFLPVCLACRAEEWLA